MMRRHFDGEIIILRVSWYTSFRRTSGPLTFSPSPLTMPGRKCPNGLNVPTANADGPTLVQGLRDAGIAAYKAAQSKSEDNMLMVAEVVAAACANCRDKYREKPKLADRCK